MPPSYCVCKKGKAGDGTGFMINCDSCDVWYHGRCIGLKRKDAPPDDSSWYCSECLKSAAQCANPPCTNGVTREKSKYCCDECGYAVNRLRYDRFFKPRYENLVKNPSEGQLVRVKEHQRLKNERDGVIQLIGRLKSEKETLEEDIKKIKAEAQRLRKENASFKEQQDDEDADMDSEDQEETTTSDQSKVFCLICGVPQPSEKAFKHWVSCHRKQEGNFNYSSDVPIQSRCQGVDEEPNLFCQRQDKKTKRYCMHIESACPQHSNWHVDKDEVCGCPLSSSQELVADGNYCFELKKDCRLHYNWDRFRLASKNMERIQAFSRLDLINDRMNRTQQSLNDTYGGVYGIMRTTTIDHAVQPNHSDANNDERIDVEADD